MGEYTKYNAQAVLAQVNNYIQILENKMEYGYDYVAPSGATVKFSHRGYDGHKGWSLQISSVYKDLSIFDWWNNTLSMSQLKQMKAFLERAIMLGFNGYACFKVGAVGCSHGMWAHKKESTDGYSPDGDVLHHSFRNGDNYFDMNIDGKWMNKLLPNREENEYKFTLAEVKQVLKGVA